MLTSKRDFPSFVIISTFFVLIPSLGTATDFKPEEPAPGYLHDRFNTEPDDHIRQFRAYTTSFDTKDDNDGDGTDDIWGIPEWVAYELQRKAANLGPAPQRPSPWITDPTLHEQGIAPDDDSYKDSGYDRGHMCMKEHAFRLGESADWNTHTVLNACPQLHEMNGGIWRRLENKCANWADHYEKIWIVCGPIFQDRKVRKWIGDPGEVRAGVPDAFFKIIAKERPDGDFDVLAFRIAQEGTANSSDLQQYLTTVDAIELATGLDFLTSLVDEMENRLECVAATDLWSLE